MIESKGQEVKVQRQVQNQRMKMGLNKGNNH